MMTPSQGHSGDRGSVYREITISERLLTLSEQERENLHTKPFLYEFYFCNDTS